MKKVTRVCNIVSVADGNFDSQSLGLRAQKKLLSKMASKKIAKVFIDDTSGHILDNLYKLSKDYTKNKKTAEKLLKNLIKIVIKIGILYRNEQFSESELLVAENFKKKFRTVAMTVVSFIEVDFTFDKNFLSQALNECRLMLKQLVERHLTDKSLNRIDQVFLFYADLDFLDAIFKSNGAHSDVLRSVVNDLNILLDNGTL